MVTGLVLPIGRPPGRPSTVAIVAATLGFVALMLTILLWWATRGLTAPLRRFAQAAAGFLLDRDAAPLPEKGSYEVRTAARAFNRMQARIRRMVEDRTRMLAAVSHDLRTPITRLRLRAEFVEGETTRAQMLRDLDQMSGMILLPIVLLNSTNVVSLDRKGSTSVRLGVRSLSGGFFYDKTW